MRLAGSKVLVTGGGRGIGWAVARMLVSHGARPILVGRDEGRLRDAAARLDGACDLRAADLSERASVEDLVAWCRAAHGDLAGLVNNAAVQHEMDLVRGDAGDCIALAREEIALNLDAPIALAIGLLPLLRRRKAAFVLNVTTGLAFAPKEAAPVYCAAKAGLHGFTQGLRYQYARHAPGLRVIEAILPLVDTDMTRGRGAGKIEAAAARAIVGGIAADRAEIWIGKAKALRILRRIAPGLPERILRGGGVSA